MDQIPYEIFLHIILFDFMMRRQYIFGQIIRGGSLIPALPLEPDPDYSKLIIKYGRTELLEHVSNSAAGWAPNVYRIAAQYNYSALKWLLERRIETTRIEVINPPYDVFLMHPLEGLYCIAAKKGDIEMMRLLRRHSVAWHYNWFYHNSAYRATDDSKILEWLYRNGYPIFVRGISSDLLSRLPFYGQS